ncbi:Uncharacterized protein PBTT_09274 [Plasmodiophora brassicae]|uniref:Uncharacterized protein n=1 Tax=Plasmodiophora brassicae TaxID=37360 RepID=A0A0G4IPI8_PLABS|nr:hypothetical protein PBRA_005720 [Plasmodiophora brassicae]SPR01093.1 unnamed protein product [Plasmodiophora brassicae]
MRAALLVRLGRRARLQSTAGTGKWDALLEHGVRPGEIEEIRAAGLDTLYDVTRCEKLSLPVRMAAMHAMEAEFNREEAEEECMTPRTGSDKPH